MKLPKLPINKYSIAGLGAGVILGGAGLAVGLNGPAPDNPRNLTTQTQPAPTEQATPAENTPTSDTPVTDQSNTSSTGSNATTGVGSTSSNSAPAPTNSPSPATSGIVPPVAPTVTDISQTSSVEGDQTIFTCHYTMSDGSTYDKLGGSALTANITRFHLQITCPSS